jgi:hypothetical protein
MVYCAVAFPKAELKEKRPYVASIIMEARQSSGEWIFACVSVRQK